MLYLTFPTGYFSGEHVKLHPRAFPSAPMLFFLPPSHQFINSKASISVRDSSEQNKIMTLVNCWLSRRLWWSRDIGCRGLSQTNSVLDNKNLKYVKRLNARKAR